MIVILMGVAGSGKTTVGQRLAATLNWQFIEGDRFHSPANVAKMRRGEPLTDVDRWPWLNAIRTEIEQIQAAGSSVVVACSALKEDYRVVLAGKSADAIKFVYLKVTPEVLRSRLMQRSGHFMKAQMLASQLATLESPDNALVLEVEAETTLATLVEQICLRLDLPTDTPEM
ncbi:MAG: gluconokinase [Cyanobacteria bacterium P01_H01_bin.58]